MMEEIWLPVDENDNYMVSNMGRIRSVDRFVESRKCWRVNGSFYRRLKGVDIKPFLSNSTGYLQVELGKSGRKSVHRLVAMAFCKGFDDGLVVNHKNGVKDDNRAENLEWITPGENISHAYKCLGKVGYSKGRLGHKHNTSKPVIATCVKTGEETYYESAYWARFDGFNSGSISRCCNGQKRSYKGMLWRFALGGTHRYKAETEGSGYA